MGNDVRHKWSKGNGWAVCEKCGCRYRIGNVGRVYEHAGGARTATAGNCIRTAIAQSQPQGRKV